MTLLEIAIGVTCELLVDIKSIKNVSGPPSVKWSSYILTVKLAVLSIIVTFPLIGPVPVFPKSSFSDELFLLTRPSPNKEIKEFIAYCLDDQKGQAIIQAMGLVPMGAKS